MFACHGILVSVLAVAVSCGNPPRSKPQLNEESGNDKAEDEKAEVEAEGNFDNDDGGDDPVAVNTPPPYSCAEPRPFISVWEVLIGGTVRLPIVLDMGDYDFTVDWGDGSTKERVWNLGQRTAEHEYEIGGEFTIAIEGYVGKAWNARLSEAESADAQLVSVEDLGNVGWESLQGAFFKMSSLGVVKGGCTTEVTDMSNMFSRAENANPDTSTWDTSKVTDMSNMFSRAENANPDTSTWDTSKVTDMWSMFGRAENANPDTSGWDTSNVGDMSIMFYYATSANPDTSGWDTSNVYDMENMFEGATSANPDTSGWDTSNVRYMTLMFYRATSANPDTSGWDTSNVTDMIQMFFNATSANPDVSNWDFSSITYISSMFNDNNSLSTENYSTLLKRLSLNPSFGGLNDGVTGVKLNVGTVKYSADASNARAHLVSEHGFLITDGGQAP